MNKLTEIEVLEAQKKEIDEKIKSAKIRGYISIVKTTISNEVALDKLIVVIERALFSRTGVETIISIKEYNGNFQAVSTPFAPTKGAIESFIVDEYSFRLDGYFDSKLDRIVFPVTVVRGHADSSRLQCNTANGKQGMIISMNKEFGAVYSGAKK